MSTPVRGADGPLGYAPRWARTTGSGRGDTASDTRVRSAPVQELPQDLRPPRIAMPPPETSPWDAASPDAPLESSGGASDEPAPHRDTKLSRTPLTAQAPEPNWKRKKRAAVFEGDAALRELRSRLASAPDQTPEPPLYQTRTPIFAAVVRLLGVMVLAAAGALGFLWLTGPRGAPPQVAGKAGSGDVAFASYRGLDATPQKPSAVENVAAPNAQSSGRTSFAVANIPEGGSTPQSALVPRTPAAPPPAPHVTAPAPAPHVTAPPPVPRVTAPPAVAAPLPAAAAPPPAVAAPALAVAAPLPAAAASPPAVAMPSPAIVAPSPVLQVPAARTVAVPPPATSVAAPPDWDEIADLLGRARTYLSSGDVAAARLVLRRAAERNDPQAALALGGTYDPTVLQRLGIVSFQADATRAREWYRKAKELGSADASVRLEQLVQ